MILHKRESVSLCVYVLCADAVSFSLPPSLHPPPSPPPSILPPPPPLSLSACIVPLTPTFMHTCPCKQVIKGLYWGADLEAATEAVQTGRATADDFLFYYKYSSWAPTQLASELNRQVPYP
jgi:hypothetical protein